MPVMNARGMGSLRDRECASCKLEEGNYQNGGNLDKANPGPRRGGMLYRIMDHKIINARRVNARDYSFAFMILRSMIL